MTSKRKISVLMLTALAIAMCAAGAGAGTVTGVTGLVVAPSADSIAPGEVEITARYVDDRLGLSFLYGLLDNIEIGVNNVAAEKGAIHLMIKGVLFEESDRLPAIALGLETGQSYAVASKRIAPGIRVHAGYGNGRIEGIFAGVSLSLNTVSSGGAVSPATTLFGEYTHDGVNVGARLVFSPAVAAEIAMLDMARLTAGASFRVAF